MIFLLIQTIKWIVDSREDFLEGYVPGGMGLDIYVTEKGELTLPGNNWDLDKNGYPDLICINENSVLGEDICYGHIFYNDKLGFSQQKVDSFICIKSEAGAVADFNKDGYIDIVYNNRMLTPYSYILFGGPKGFTKKDSFISSPLHGAISVGDIDNDGFLDLVWSTMDDWNFWNGAQAYIMWGSENGFSIQDTTALRGHMAHGNCIADFNNDGFLDIIIFNHQSDTSINCYSYIYWGNGSRNFSDSCMDSIFTPGAGDDVTIVDLNNDGFLDIAMPVRRLMLPASQGAEDPFSYSYIYYNDPLKPGKFRLVDSLPTGWSWSCSAGKINKDEFPDLVFTNAKGYSYIFINDKGRKFFLLDSLFNKEGTAIMLADYNRDGLLDIATGNQGWSKIYVFYAPFWKRSILNTGKIDASITRDLGSIMNRSDTVTYFSRVYDAGEICKLINAKIVMSERFLCKNAGVPTLKIRSKGPGIEDSWSSWFVSSPPLGRYFQFRLDFNTKYYPQCVDKVILEFKKISEIYTQEFSRSFIFKKESKEMYFYIPENTQKIIIYEVSSGKKIFEETINGSKTIFHWNFKDMEGREVGKGVYILKIYADSIIKIKIEIL